MHAAICMFLLTLKSNIIANLAEHITAGKCSLVFCITQNKMLIPCLRTTYIEGRTDANILDIKLHHAARKQTN